jgi:hypothetical protein
MPRQEGKSAFLTLSEHILRRAVGEIVTVLHAADDQARDIASQFCNPDIAHRDPTAWLGM